MDKVKPRPCSFNYNWLRQRETGHKPPIGFQDKFMKSLYSHIMPCSTWDYNDNLQHTMPGGVFNLEFSPDGSLLVAACEKRSILMFDPLSRKLIHAVDNAHFDCVNCVRFLDSRVFATCSDDSTVALWDARNLRSRIRTLQGHSNWVKNIEFSQRDGLLVTSGFDGSIYTWDINSYTEVGFLYKRVFHTNGLMRTRLNPDGSKMIICTTGGYLIVIHDLDLRTLKDDLEGFKPNMYRLMQLSQTTIPVAATFTHLFSRRRKSNRIEFVTDFPDGDDAEVVSSLQVHPQGWCALSRNISNDEHSEWTCIHDIQEPDYPKDSMENEPPGEPDILGDDEEVDAAEGMVVIGPNSRARVLNNANQETRQQPFRRMRTGTSNPLSPNVNRSSNVSDASGTNGSSPFRGFSNGSSPFRGWANSDSARDPNIVVTSTDVWEALVAIREARTRRERNRVQDRRLGGSGILMPDQEPHTRFRIVRMSSGLVAADIPRARSRGYIDDSMLSIPHQNGVPDAVDIGSHDHSSAPAADGNSSGVFDRPTAPAADSVASGDFDRPTAPGADGVASGDDNRPTAPAADGVASGDDTPIAPAANVDASGGDDRPAVPGAYGNSSGDYDHPAAAAGDGNSSGDYDHPAALAAYVNSSGDYDHPAAPAAYGNSSGDYDHPAVAAGDGNSSGDYDRPTAPAADGVASEDNDRPAAPAADGNSSGDYDPPTAPVADGVPSLDPDRHSTPYPPNASVSEGGGSVASIVIRYRRPHEQGDQAPNQNESQPSTSSNPRTILILGSNSNPSSRARGSGCRIRVPKNHKIHQNTPRLSHFIEEPNVGRGFIKELCFSSDGRLICSPFGYGVRLLAFSPECSELSTCVPKEGAVKLYELGTNVCHADIVVSTKFSPRHCLLVSGCLTGRIVWHQPVV